MIKHTIFYFLLFFFLISLSGCRKEMVVVETTGDLVVNARDGVGNSLIGTTIYLYDNRADFNNNLYSLTGITDNSGQVIFVNLYPAIYYVDCDFISTTGQTITITGSSSVSAGYETTITIRP